MAQKAVIFDLFGTLVDFSVHCHNEYVGRMAAAAGGNTSFEASFNALLQDLTIGRIDLETAVRNSAKNAGAPSPAARISAIMRVWSEGVGESLTPRSGAVETLEELKTLGLGLGVISGSLPPVGDLWAGSAFGPFIANPVLSYEVGMHKPDERVYRLACDSLGVAPEDCLYIGDGTGGELTGAQKFGHDHDSDSRGLRGCGVHSFHESGRLARSDHSEFS